jgi:hypothetical protein
MVQFLSLIFTKGGGLREKIIKNDRFNFIRP